ncbi:MAG: methyltransferase domain-containing protein [Actinomycetota bacterium]|nr:methyltransferase domain-containing protein [Actinomycetota bacterium]
MTGWYRGDLAYIHDVGHADFALESAPGILEIMERGGIMEGLVVDLGCGSGLWARELIGAGYRVLGIDISEAMIEIARRKVPEAEFRVGSLFEADIPPCVAVTALSEVLNYLFDPESEDEGLAHLFGRVHDALVPGGIFVFDVLGPGQVSEGGAAKSFRMREDWAVLSEKEEDSRRRTLTPRITSFRRVGEHYRRDDEVHRLRLYGSSEVAQELRRVGFRVRTMRAYGRYPLPRSHAAFVARKAATRTGLAEGV